MNYIRSDFLHFLNENPFATNEEIRIALNISEGYAKTLVSRTIKCNQIRRVFENGTRKLIVNPNNKYFIQVEDDMEETDDMKNSLYQEILDDLLITIRTTTNETDKREAQKMVMRILENT